MARGNRRATHHTMTKAAERRLEVLQLAKGGATMRQIGERLGITPQAAHKALKKALADLAEETSNATVEYRELNRARIEMAMVAISSKVTKGDLFAIDRWLKLIDRLNRMYGVEAPQKWAQTDSEGADIDDKPPTEEERYERFLALLDRRAEAGDLEIPTGRGKGKAH